MKALNIEKVNNGFLVSFATPLRRQPPKIDTSAFPAGMGDVINMAMPVVASMLPESPRFREERLVFKTYEELQSWLAKYFSEPEVAADASAS
jgi:hypothetical protein